MNNKVYVDDSGTKLVLFTGYVIPDTATETQIWIELPGGDVLKKDAAVEGSSLSYELLPTDISVVGTYTAAAYIVSPDFPTGKMGEPFRFKIYAPFT